MMEYIGELYFVQGFFLNGIYQALNQMDYENIIPDGKNIENVKTILFNLAVMCMVFHEFAHIYKGHLQLRNQWATDKEIAKNLDMQTLEWDADSYAATNIVLLVGIYKRGNKGALR